jgi:hypothetical protein
MRTPRIKLATSADRRYCKRHCIAPPAGLLPCAADARNEKDDRKSRKEARPSAELGWRGSFSTQLDVEHSCDGGKHYRQQQRHHVPSGRNTPANHPAEEPD